MKITLLIIAFHFTSAAFAQNFLPWFVCPYNGKLIHPYTSVLPGNPDKIAVVKFCETRSYTSEGIAQLDTFVVYKTHYTPTGDQLSLEDYYYGEFEGFKNISYDKKGNLLTKEFDYHRMQGCGNYAAIGHGTLQYTYTYKDDLLMKVTGNNGRLSIFTYNRHKDKIARDDYSSQTALWSYRYGYDSRHRLTREYMVNNIYDKVSDSLFSSLPDDMERILLRQFPPMYDHYLRKEFGISEDSLINYEDELPAKLTERINKRDEEDAALIEKYETMSTLFISYQYNKRGLLHQRMVFDDDEPDTLETFFYDMNDRLVKWVSETNFSNENAEEKVPAVVWDFKYDTKDRVTSLQCTEYNNLGPEETQRWELNYNDIGMAGNLKISHKSDSFDYSDTYFLLYDRSN